MIMLKGAILYIADYIEEKGRKDRKIGFFFPARNNKVIGIARSFAAKGYNVLILSSGWTKELSGSYYPRGEIELEDGIKLIYAPLKDFRYINILSTVCNIIKEAAKLAMIYDIKAIVFYNFVFNTALPAIILKCIFGKKIIAEFEESYCYDFNKKFLLNYALEKLGRYFADGAIISTSLLKYRLRTKTPFCLIRGFYAGFKGEQPLPHRPAKVVMYGGRWDEERGVDIFLEALKYVKSCVNVVITGSGPYRELVCRKSKQLLENNVFVEIHEAASREEYIKLLNQADILVNPQKSKNSFGKVSFPSKVYEYMSTGKTVISSDISDIEEFAEGRVVVYKNDDPVLLAEKIDDVIMNHHLYKHYGVNSLEWIKGSSSYEKAGDQLEWLIRNIEKVKK